MVPDALDPGADNIIFRPGAVRGESGLDAAAEGVSDVGQAAVVGEAPQQQPSHLSVCVCAIRPYRDFILGERSEFIDEIYI